MFISAAAFAAEEGTQGGNDVGEDAEAFVDDNAVGYKTADSLCPAGGLGQGGVELAGSLRNTLTGSLQTSSYSPLPLLQGKEDVGGVKNAGGHDAASSSSSSS